jgi:hypothetical protein
MTKRSEDRVPTTSQVLEAAIKAQLDQAERIRPGGAHDMVAGLSRDDQRTVMSVVNKS